MPYLQEDEFYDSKNKQTNVKHKRFYSQSSHHSVYTSNSLLVGNYVGDLQMVQVGPDKFELHTDVFKNNTYDKEKTVDMRTRRNGVSQLESEKLDGETLMNQLTESVDDETEDQKVYKEAKEMCDAIYHKIMNEKHTDNAKVSLDKSKTSYSFDTVVNQFLNGKYGQEDWKSSDVENVKSGTQSDQISRRSTGCSIDYPEEKSDKQEDDVEVAYRDIAAFCETSKNNQCKEIIYDDRRYYQSRRLSEVTRETMKAYFSESDDKEITEHNLEGLAEEESFLEDKEENIDKRYVGNSENDMYEGKNIQIYGKQNEEEPKHNKIRTDGLCRKNMEKHVKVLQYIFNIGVVVIVRHMSSDRLKCID